MSCVVKLPRSIWDPFKQQFDDIPHEVLGRLLDAIEMKVKSTDHKPSVSMIWQCDHYGVQYTSALQIDIIYKGEVGLVSQLKGAFYSNDLPQMELDA